MSTQPAPQAAASAREVTVDNNLAGVAKALAGVFVAIAGVGAAFGISQEKLLVAVNNDLMLFVFVAGFALLAVTLSIASMFCSNKTGGNVLQSVILALGVFFYLTALVITVWGVARYATGHGRPNITNLSVVPGSPMKVHLTVHADGVQNDKMIIVEAEGFKGETPVGEKPLYRTIMHADDNGDVEQKLEFVWEPGEATRLTIRARHDHETKNGATCEPSEYSEKLGCASIVLPPPVKKS
ncbi:hypothetical protein [Streptomyces sp. NPDC085540]|uniref:hypothetical protein n=1 Tax=Streptomyces sp. NPDC085540 TaxID=3365730 RepID=UPI0037D5BB0A